MNNKTIQLNPEFLSSSKLSSGGGGGSTTRQKKEKPKTSLKPNAMKKQLLAKIKDFQHKSENDKEEFTIKTDTLKDDDFNAGFADEFNKSLSFLSELSKQRKHKPKRNETLKRGKIEHSVHTQIATELPEEMKQKPLTSHITTQASFQKQAPVIQAPVTHAPAIHAPVQVQVPVQIQALATQAPAPATHAPAPAPAPSYGILKNGSKPTYRQYHNKTQKIYGHVTKPLISIQQNEPTQIHTPSPSNANQLSAVESSSSSSSSPALGNTLNSQINTVSINASHNIKPSNQRFKKRITRTLKYSLGKHKNGKVSVLIKNAKTRRKIQTEQALLKQKSIADIKVYLRSKNLLKVGSEVPNDVLRQLYENAILAGDVTNKSKDTLLHNFFNDK